MGEAEDEDEEVLEEEEIPEEEEVEEETEEATTEMDQDSPASTAAERDTRPPIAQVRRNLEERGERRGREMEKEEIGRLLR